MDTWILKMIRVVSLRRVLAWGASLVCGVLLATERRPLHAQLPARPVRARCGGA